MFGGGFSEEVKRTKRGAELFMHNATIVLTILFVSVAIALMLLGENQSVSIEEPVDANIETITNDGSGSVVDEVVEMEEVVPENPTTDQVVDTVQ